MKSSKVITRSDVCVTMEMIAHYMTEMACHICRILPEEKEEWQTPASHREIEVSNLDEGALDGAKRVLQRYSQRFNEKDPEAVAVAIAAIEGYLDELKTGQGERELTGLLKFAWELDNSFVTSVLDALKKGEVASKVKHTKK